MYLFKHVPVPTIAPYVVGDPGKPGMADIGDQGPSEPGHQKILQAEDLRRFPVNIWKVVLYPQSFDQTVVGIDGISAESEDPIFTDPAPDFLRLGDGPAVHPENTGHQGLGTGIHGNRIGGHGADGDPLYG